MNTERSLYITQNDFEKLRGLIAGYKPRNEFEQDNLDMLVHDLERAHIVDPSDIPANVVTMNSKLYVRDIDSMEEMMFTLVFPKDADLSKDKISVLAPIGSSVLGYKTGDIIQWKMPNRVRNLKIETVIYQPEAAGNYSR
jgi:regulator of nucleoside diphosphate kinase